ncbi:recombinase family protein [Sulfitobacter sp. 1A16808]|uniref:recombinase family protein n=1 Tax=Sulfitobacter sp. 1A16808 TaxID=3368572 RepID=UPI0037461DBD
MASGRFVSYLRVSTKRQGQEGLGIAAQRRAVEEFLNGGSWELISEFIEVESGGNNQRVELQRAIATAKAHGAKLLIAKLDRLSRNASFLLSLRDAGVEFVAADMPDANRFTVGIMALVAEQEREAISQRTKAALKAAKARGVQLGAYREGVFVGRVGTSKDVAKARAAKAANAQVKAENLRFVMDRVDPAGTLSLRQLAAQLNADGIPTPSGRGRWAPQTVKRLKGRLGLQAKPERLPHTL